MENVKVRAVRSISAIRDAIKSKKYNVQKRVIVTERSRRSRVYFTPKQGGADGFYCTVRNMQKAMEIELNFEE